MENLTGQSLKGYELLERIGSGGFGAVYRAYQSTIGREVAVKIILPHFASRPEFIRRFEAEAQLVARLEHLHIVPLYDYWRDPGGAYLVMRWLRGGSVADALGNGPFGLEATAALLDQMAAALTVAHAADVIHRDLKPSNILLDEEGNAYLADFGIAADMRHSSGNGNQSKAIIGSPAYLAPEQVRGETPTPQTDVYSLGVTVHELLGGAHPFAGTNRVALLYKQINDPLPPLTTLEADVQAEIGAVIQQATAKDPRQRYEDVLSFALAFRKAARLKGREVEELVELLTPREQEVLDLIVAGLTNRQIAQELFVEHATVKWYIRQIYGKLEVRNRRQAIARVREKQLAATETTVAEGESTSIVMPRPVLTNPYKGLRAFTAADQSDFFGREALLARLLERLKLPDGTGARDAAPGTGRFVAIVGPSGSGKSSLVRAGLIPALWEGRLPGSNRWFVGELTPGLRPLDELEVALMRLASNQADNLHELLLRDENGLQRAAQLILPRDDSELLLVLDQFEELFGLVEDEKERAFFLELLAAAVTDARSRVRVALTLRADYYDRPLQYRDFGQLVQAHLETVLPLKAEELEQAIVKPAEQVGTSFAPGLVTRIIDDVLYQPGALPLLQYALTELFEQRDGHTITHQAYEAIGGATGALATRAEELYLEQDERGRELLRQMLLRLVSVGQADDATLDTRRPVPLAELMELDAREDVLEEIIDIFTAYRLLTLDHDAATRRPTVELAHEALLREWRRLGEWLEESRADLRLRRQLERAAAEWRRAARDPSFVLRGSRLAQFESWSKDTQLSLTSVEQDYLQASAALRDELAASEAAREAREAKLEQRARCVLQGLILVLLVAAVTSGWFAWDANRNFARSESQRLAAEATNVLQRGGSPELAGLLALRALAVHYTPQADLALQRAEATYVDSTLLDVPGGALWPMVSPNNRYLRFMRDDSDPSGEAIAELWDLQTGERLWEVRGYIMGPYPAVIRDFTADYSAVVAATQDDEELVLLDVETGKQVLAFEGATSDFEMYQLSADGKILVAGLRDGSVLVWNTDTREEIRRFTAGDGEYTRFIAGREIVVAVSWDSQFITATADGVTHVWSLASGKEIYRFEHDHQGWDPPRFVDGGSLFLAAVAPSLSVWNLSNKQEIEHGIPPGNGGVLSPDGRLFAEGWVGPAQQTILVWEVATGRALHRLAAHADGATPLAFINGGRQLITWGSEGTARIWDTDSGEELFVLAGHADAMRDAVVSPDERLLVTTGQDETVRIWDLQTALHTENQIGGARYVFQISPGRRVALTIDPRSAVSGGAAVLADADSFAVLHHLDIKLNAWYDGAAARPPFSGDGRFVLGMNDAGAILVYDVSNGGLVGAHTNPDGRYIDAAFVPGSQHIFAGGDRGAYLLDAESGERLRLFEVPDTSEYLTYGDIVGVSGDGRYGALHVTTDYGYFNVYLWELETGAKVFESMPHPNDATVAFGFSNDSRYFSWGGTGNVVHVRDLQRGEETIRLPHLDSIHDIQFSSDNRSLLTSTGGDGVILWDLKSRDVVRRFFAPAGQAGFARFAENDSFVLYAGLEDGSIRRQPVSPEGLSEDMCAKLRRDLTVTERQRYGLDNSPTCSKFTEP